MALALCGARALASVAADGSDDPVPESLKPWKGWVLHGQEAWLCPEVEGMRDRAFCAWPGELKLDVMRQGGGGMKFSQNWELQYESAVPLPGNRKYWPQQVTVNGKAHPVLTRGGAPVVWLKKGRYAVNGWIPWQERPQAMDIPENVALVSLVVDGKSVLPLERHGKALTLGAQEGTVAREGDSLDLQVLRKLTDGLPALLTTRVRLKVSGQAREWSVPDILPRHFVPVRLTSPWAARLDADGRLQVQVMPGQTMIEIQARLDQPLENVEPVFSQERAQEIWSYEAVPSLRTTVISPGENMLAVDPRQAGVSGDWLSLPAFVVGPGARFQVEERFRGQNEREGQRLTLQRDMWLDFSGKGFFARDRIEGTMRQGWRFDVAKPYTLERADSLAMHARSASGDLSAALLVTYGADETLTGVEWRQPNVTLNAGVRLETDASSRVAVTGWQQAFDSVDAALRVPYGYKLIAVPGADSVSGNVWVERWTILSLFLAAFFALLAWRLFGVAGGVVAVVYLTLAMHEPDAPVHSFAAAVILALLCRAMPEGRLRKVLLAGERVALLCFVGAAVVFIPVQIRAALYPQLEERDAARIAPAAMHREEAFAERRARGIAEFNDEGEAAPDFEALAEPWQAAGSPPLAATAPAAPESQIKARPGSSSVPAKSKLAHEPEFRQRYAQSTVTQTGGGEPAWEVGHLYRLHWSGPVTEAQSVRLLVSPPWLTRLLRLLTVTLLGWLVWRLVCVAFPGVGVPVPLGKPRASGVSPAKAALPVLCFAGLVAAGLWFTAPAAAATAGAQSGSGVFPSDELLGKLKTRLLEAPACAPVCADVSRARVDADASRLRLLLVAHVGEPASLALPEPDKQMIFSGARVNGQTWPVLRVSEKSFVALPGGVHQVQLEYAVSGDTASLSFPIRPAQIEFGSAHWQVDGVDEGRLLGETLNFSRITTATSSGDRRGEGNVGAASSSLAQQFPPFVHVQRDLVFDLDWNLRTRVTRIAPVEGGFTFPVPLLSGEHVTTPEVRVQDGCALAAFATKTGSVSWVARLDKAKSIELRAPPLSDYAETWRVTVNPSWHLEWNGVPVTLSGGEKNIRTSFLWSNQAAPAVASIGGEDVVFEFHPLPGEKLVLALTWPVKTESGIRAIDRVRLENNVGQHASDVILEFSLRASQGGEHLITLPPELEVLEVRRNGTPLNLQPSENRLSLPVSPGEQTYMFRLRGQGDIGFLTSSPEIDLGLPAANIDLRTALGEQRWILAAKGPAVGPAVLYWGELLAALLLAFLLARSGVSSLKRWQWFLLVLGFSTFSWLTLFILTLWLIVIDWRVRCGSCADWSAHRFNAMQAGIVILTIAMLNGLIRSVPEGLLGMPDMVIRGYDTYGGKLAWFVDRSDPLLPVVTVFSLPIWFYRVLMLAWTLWLANILIRWLRQGLSAWIKNGYWKKTGWSLKKKEPPAASGASGGKQERT
ncbi:MAG: hypothetical protein LBP99_01935 [Azoarcus sp.]|nr:hypothetical protein [Azoarcus sp.]